MNWIFLSPHPDDIALSCGGLVWERAQAGDRVQVWTICAGDPPHREFSTFAHALHTRWETGVLAVEQRRAEDRRSCAIMQAAYRHFNIPDCIYRPRRKSIPHYYLSGEDIFGRIHPAERKNLVARLARLFRQEIPPDAQVVCPLTLGNHVDHQITRLAVERTARYLLHPILYYADYPYVRQYPGQLDRFRQQGWECVHFTISKPGLDAWCDAIAAHGSQISTFWQDLAQIHLDIETYSRTQDGLCAWKKPQ